MIDWIRHSQPRFHISTPTSEYQYTLDTLTFILFTLLTRELLFLALQVIVCGMKKGCKVSGAVVRPTPNLGYVCSCGTKFARSYTLKRHTIHSCQPISSKRDKENSDPKDNPVSNPAKSKDICNNPSPDASLGSCDPDLLFSDYKEQEEIPLIHLLTFRWFFSMKRTMN